MRRKSQQRGQFNTAILKRSFCLITAEETAMWRCTVCGYIYDDAKEGTKFEDLPDDWSCPVCNAPKDAFVRI